MARFCHAINRRPVDARHVRPVFCSEQVLPAVRFMHTLHVRLRLLHTDHGTTAPPAREGSRCIFTGDSRPGFHSATTYVVAGMASGKYRFRNVEHTYRQQRRAIGWNHASGLTSATPGTFPRSPRRLTRVRDAHSTSGQDAA